jgi:hypothetical protein
MYWYTQTYLKLLGAAGKIAVKIANVLMDEAHMTA